MTSAAQASGPTERLLQVLVHPSAPDVVVLRYAVPQGGASHGFLFSRDRGASFQALCSEGVAPDAERSDRISRISTKPVPSAAPVVLDAAGRVVFSQLDGLWSDDGTGCSWAKQQGTIGENWPFSLIVDPSDPAALLALVTTRGADNLEAKAELMRRDASGTWSVVGALKPPMAEQRVYSGELVAAATGMRLYATANVSVGPPTDAQERGVVLASDDGGKTWREAAPIPAEANGEFVLLAVDPLDPNRVLATVSRESAADTLLLSEDQGASFRDYGELVATSGITFAPDGRVYVGDAGDDASADTVGGVWTAARLGEPLTKIESTRSIDCLHYDPASSKLRVCMRTRFGQLDPTNGAFEETARLQNIESLLSCPSLDTAAVCEAQLNQGSSWCCAGHYPFTPFCGQYDVTEANGKSVLCGVSGREYESMDDAGAGPSDAGVRQDAGTSPRDAGVAPRLDGGARGSDDEDDEDDDGAGESARNGDDGGCAVRARPPSATSAGGALVSAGLLLLAFGRSLRRRRKS